MVPQLLGEESTEKTAVFWKTGRYLRSFFSMQIQTTKIEKYPKSFVFFLTITDLYQLPGGSRAGCCFAWFQKGLTSFPKGIGQKSTKTPTGKVA